MIYYNTNIINDWNFDETNVIKVYRNNAVVFYKLTTDSPTPTYKVCYAVVDDITQYSETEFEDVYDKATGKWYKLNNINQYEQYGIYGEGRNITYYEGKLTVDDGYEYEWNGSQWANLGEVSGSSRVPSEYVELTYAQTSKVTSSSSNAFTVPIDLQATNNYIYEFTPLNWEDSYYGHILGGNDGSTNFPKFGIFKLDNGWGDETKRFVSAFWNYNLMTRGTSPGGNYRVYNNVKSKFTMNLHNYTVGQGADIKVENEGYETVTHTSTTIFSSGYSVISGIYNIDVFSTSNGSSAYIASEQFHNLKVETNEGVAVYDYVPCKRNSDNKVGLYDVVNNAFYSPSAFTLTAGDEASHTEYPKYYSEKSEPLDSLTFSTMEDAQAYAYNNCVYDGMHAKIDGDKYYFDSSDENGWVEDTSYTIWLDPSATNALFNIGHYWGENYKMVFTTYLSGSYSGDYGSFWQGNGHTPIELSFYSNGFYYDMHNPTSTTAPNVKTTDNDYRILRQSVFSNYQNSQKIKITLTYGSFKAELADSGTLIFSSGSTKTGYSWYSGLYQASIGLNNANAKCHLSNIQIYNANNELVNDLKFIKNSGVVGAQEISLYDSVTNTTYNNTNSNTPVYHIET